MLKHFGKYDGKDVIIVYRELPHEEHMCVVIYPAIIPSKYSAPVQQVLKTDKGQMAESFADVLYEFHFENDEMNMLNRLHKDGMMKKVPTNAVNVTPNAKTNIRLDELNRLIGQIKEGGEAAAELERLDQNSGYASPDEIARDAKARAEIDLAKQQALQEQNNIYNQATQQVAQETVQPLQAGNNDVLTDEVLARNSLNQAEQMIEHAKQMLEEAENMKNEAYEMDPSLKPKRGRGRPRGATKK